MKKSFLTVSLFVWLVGCGEPELAAPQADAAGNRAAAPRDLATDEERVLYSLGAVIGQDIAMFDLTEAELEFVADGMRDVINDIDLRVELDVYGPQIQALADDRRLVQVEAEKAAAALFADQIAAEPGAERSASGLVFSPLIEGDGANPVATDVVTVHYHGTFRDGTVFDSSLDREPATFELQGVIPCWTEGVQKIRVGGKARLLCPSDIAYGDAGRQEIPGGAALLFEVELLGIE